jgi:hypothetical protein
MGTLDANAVILSFAEEFFVSLTLRSVAYEAVVCTHPERSRWPRQRPLPPR